MTLERETHGDSMLLSQGSRGQSQGDRHRGKKNRGYDDIEEEDQHGCTAVTLYGVNGKERRDKRRFGMS